MTIKEFIYNYGYIALSGKKIKINDNIIGYIHQSFFKQDRDEYEWIEERIKKGGNPHFRLYGGVTAQSDDELFWIYSTNEVIM